jgi:type IV pilus assembly protein PilN
MIKINLVGERKRPAAPGPSQLKGIQEGANVGIWALAGLVLAGVLITLGHLYVVNGKVKDMQQQVAEAEKEVKELEPYIREVEEYKAKKAELERKVQVIKQLKTNQRGPVQIMDRVSRALPELMWLTKMEVSPTTITVSGEAFNTNAVANFIENLDRVPEFQEPILRDTSQRGQIYTFVVAFNYTYQVPQPEQPEGAEAAAG